MKKSLPPFRTIEGLQIIADELSAQDVNNVLAEDVLSFDIVYDDPGKKVRMVGPLGGRAVWSWQDSVVHLKAPLTTETIDERYPTSAEQTAVSILEDNALLNHAALALDTDGRIVAVKSISARLAGPEQVVDSMRAFGAAAVFAATYIIPPAE